MSSKVRLPKEKVNFFDGQNVTENDLDTEQIYHETTAAEIASDFHGSGVLNFEPFSDYILLDTRYPGKYNSNSQNSSKIDIENGAYDGKGIFLDRQPSDIVRGNRLVFEMVDVDIIGRHHPKVLVVGRTFNGIDSSGIVNYEIIEFEENTAKISQFYYQEIIAIFLNNFSGGSGKTEVAASAESLDLISKNNGYLIIKEVEPLKVFSQPIMLEQTSSPNLALANFITSSTALDIKSEIALALDAASSLSDLFIEFDAKEQVTFEKDGSVTKIYGQKFLAKSNNLQRIDLALSVERDDSQPAGQEFDWTGDLVLGIHEIISGKSENLGTNPKDLIEFDPHLTPIIEVSFNQDDLAAFGYKLTDDPQIVSFNFASTLLADPNIEPSLEKNKFYAFLISRRGDNRTGSLRLEKGYDTITRKEELGLELSIAEQFSKQETRFVEYDDNREKFIDDAESSLWFRIFSNDIEITAGTAYSNNGKSISIPKTVPYIGGNEISYFENHLSLATMANGEHNYVILDYVQKFTDGGTHPLTGNFVFTRIQDAAAGSVITSAELNKILEDEHPLILARVTDHNIRDAVDLEGELDKPGQIQADKIIIINPSANLLNTNLIGRVITPDTDCMCNSRYRIADVVCREILAGDLNNNGKVDNEDIKLLLDVAGNTINSRATERAILGGELELLDFVKSDLNNDGTVDGLDIDLIEDAVDGFKNFSITEKIKVLELILENILEENDYPILFTDTGNSGITESGTNLITVTTTTRNQALAFRPGDTIEVPASSLDAGSYKILSKTVEADGLTVEFEVETLDGDNVTFQGSTSFNLVIISGTRVNTFADNFSLLDVPYVTKNYSISFMDFPFSQRFIEVCDLRRFTTTSFIEEQVADPCACDNQDCAQSDDCSPVYKNQHYFPGDIYLPNGQILTEPGVPHPGDYEYVNVLVPLPPGTISDCSIDLYHTFVAVDTDCKTAAGFPAMKYSDGTYVGCNDSGSITDLSLNRVKFSHAIASLYVDAFVDGYAIDGYADASVSSENEEAISEQFIDYSYRSFSSWNEDAFNDGSLGTIQHPAGPNEPAVFDITTINSASEKYLQINSPVEAQSFSGNFIVDITAARFAWPQSTLTSGLIHAYSVFEIVNDDGSTATLKLGWKGTGGSTTKIVFSGVIKDASSVIIDSFEFLEDAPDAVGEEILFRLRRIDDAVFAYYLVPGKVGNAESEFGHYNRLGQSLSTQPGDGTVTLNYQVNQSNSPNAGLNFIVNVKEVIFRSEFEANSNQSSILIGRDDSTNQINRLACNFPINLTSRTNIINATLSLTASASSTSSDTFHVIPFGVLNASTLGTIYNIPETQESSYIVSFTPGTLNNGNTLEIDVTNAILGLLTEPGHLPGFFKGFLIEPSSSADSSISVNSDISLKISYEDITTGVVFQVGVSVDPATGIATFNTKNILYDSLIEENRTTIQFGVHLKKAGFKNNDLQISISDLSRIGIGTCKDEDTITGEDECWFVVGSTSVSTFVEGPFPCSFHLP